MIWALPAPCWLWDVSEVWVVNQSMLPCVIDFQQALIYSCIVRTRLVERQLLWAFPSLRGSFPLSGSCSRLPFCAQSPPRTCSSARVVVPASLKIALPFPYSSFIDLVAVRLTRGRVYPAPLLPFVTTRRPANWPHFLQATLWHSPHLPSDQGPVTAWCHPPSRQKCSASGRP